MKKLAPSILSADLLHMRDVLAAIERAGCQMLHLDVMDGHFVPNLTFGPNLVESLRRATSLTLDTHLMIANPDRYLDDFAAAGADIITVHQEACPHLHRTIAKIRSLGKSPGVAINPATPLTTLGEIIDDVDLVLVMSVNPGFGGQSFIPRSLEKISRLRHLLEERGILAEIEVDGGVKLSNIEAIASAGADIVVAGSALFETGDVLANATTLMTAIQRTEAEIV